MVDFTFVQRVNTTLNSLSKAAVYIDYADIQAYYDLGDPISPLALYSMTPICNNPRTDITCSAVMCERFRLSSVRFNVMETMM